MLGPQIANLHSNTFLEGPETKKFAELQFEKLIWRPATFCFLSYQKMRLPLLSYEGCLTFGFSAFLSSVCSSYIPYFFVWFSFVLPYIPDFPMLQAAFYIFFFHFLHTFSGIVCVFKMKTGSVWWLIELCCNKKSIITQTTKNLKLNFITHM